VGAQLVEEADTAVLGPEGDVVLTEAGGPASALAVHEVIREREGQPVVLPHEPAHRCLALDEGHHLVLGPRRHDVSFESGLREGVR
jgi:hypothetical protein